MKTSCLFLTFFFTATVWAESDTPLVFFVHIDDTLVPLSGKVYKNAKNTGLFHWGDPSSKPLEFTYKDLIATTDYPFMARAGLYHSFFAYGPNVDEPRLSLYGNGKIGNQNFFTCKLPNSIYNLITTFGKFFESCKEVDIYLLKYNRTTRTAVEEETVLRKNERQPFTVYPSFPLVFFVKMRNIYFPLSEIGIKDDGVRYRILTHGKKSTPTEFMLIDQIAIAANEIPVYVSFHDGFISVTPTIYPARLKFDTNMMLQDHTFSSCELLPPSMRWIIEKNNTTMKVKNCFDVEIYLLPYDRATGTVRNSWKTRLH